MENKKINRRRFLIKAGIGAGVLIGVGVMSCGPMRRILAKTAERPLPYINSYDAFVWFELQPNGEMVLYSPKIEMGQGIFTALTQIAAEELEMDCSKIKVVHASSAHGPIDPISTGGSLSVTGLYEPVRALAATMREMIRQNAAAILNTPPSVLSIKNGEVTGNGKTISFGDIATQAKTWDLNIKTPTLKPASDFKIIGQSIPRVDLRLKVLGEPLFGIDATFPDMLYGSVARPPFFGAKFKGAEIGAVAAMSGVVKVVIEKDFAAVVAKSRFEAEEAKRALKVNWEMPSSLVQQSDIEALVKVGVGDDVLIQKSGSTSRLEAAGTFTREYFSPLGAHAHIEPNGATASYADGKVVVKMSTQVVDITRKEVAHALGIETDKVDIQPQYIGGGFGRRLQTPHAIEAALLSKAVGKPVHVFFERVEEFQNGFLRPPTHNVLKAELSHDGQIVAMAHHTASGDVAFNAALFADVLNPLPADWGKRVIGADFGAWRGGLIQYEAIPNFTTTAWHHSLPFQTSWWRGLGLLANTFAIESFMDELAHHVKQDPVAFRLKHLADDERGQSLKGVIQLVAEKAGWGTALPEGRARGIAASTDVQCPVAQIAEVSIKDGQIKVHKVTCAIDSGVVINPDGIRAQCEGAITMGMSAALFEEVTVKDGMATPNSFGLYNIAMLKDAPDIEVHIRSTGSKPRGIGEPPMGPIGAAIANAVFALTGKRVNRIPISQHFKEL